MREHPYLRLLLHDDEELAALLGSPVGSSRTLHEWPLSCVQRLELVDGRLYAYKSQRPPTVEGEFYEVARSPLFAQARTLYQGRRAPLLVRTLDERVYCPHTLAASGESYHTAQGVPHVQDDHPRDARRTQGL